MFDATGFYDKHGKRLLDIAIAASALVMFGPILAFLTAIIRIHLGHPVFFRQVRPGLCGVPFTLLKFRTMSELRTSDGVFLPDGERMTRLGRLLRSTSLDELPELWNVLRGEMSLVGPRPLLTQYLDRYTPEQARRHAVRPGLTGWAQVNGRNAIAWEDRLALDVWYVDHVSFRLDLQILIQTVWIVLRRTGITADGEATMTEFQGMLRLPPADPDHIGNEN